LSKQLPREEQFSVRRNFPAGSKLGFFMQVQSITGSPVVMNLKIYRGNQAVVISNPQTLETRSSDNGGPNFVSSELALEGLPPGSYVLEITGIDPATKSEVAQQVSFWITK
jgi:hypothetical protein